MRNDHAAASTTVYEQASAQLVLAGWTVELDMLDPPWFQLRLEHPLSSQHIVSFDTRRRVFDDLARVLAEPEFAIIAEAPQEAPHSSLLRALRQTARGLEWPESVLEAMAEILGGHSVLTAAEADWLCSAGAAWPSADTTS